MKRIYKSVRKLLSSKQKGKLSQVAFILSKKPTVKVDNLESIKKFPNGQNGGLIISADFELAWAWQYAKSFNNSIKVADEKANQARKNFPKLLDLFENYNIPITWATVGHLFLKECKNGDHDWMHRIPHFENNNWRFNLGDWYAHDPHSNYIKDPQWYAPDLIEKIISSKVNHEIGCHTFSHIDFSYKNCPPDVADDEMKACQEVAKPYGVQLKSLVFPGGTWGNIEMLKKHGIEIYRKNVECDLAYPWRDEYGLLVTNSSGALEHNLNYKWSTQYFINRLKKYIDKAIKTNTIAHLWFHPSLNPYFLEKVFPAFLNYASEKREKEELWIGTMEDIADHINLNKII